MEQRLKRERNRLCRRIILILLAVWLTVSAVFCAVRLNSEKVSVKSRELADISQIKQLLMVGNGSYNALNRVLLEYTDLVYEDGSNAPFDTHLLVTDRKTGEVVADSADAVAMRCFLQITEEFTDVIVGLLHYEHFREALGEERYAEIEDYLRTERADGDHYELIATRFRFERADIIPLELQVVLVSGADPRFTVGEPAATYTLEKNRRADSDEYACSTLNRSTIPADFLLSGARNRDLIGGLTRKEQHRSVDLFPQGGFSYLFYTSDYLDFEAPAYIDSDGAQVAAVDDSWLLQYAKQVDLLDNCRRDLALGVALIFGFFLTIAAILCLMVWTTVRTQIVQEQKRLDLTNALAHDIKTPLFVISGYAYSLKEDIDETERGDYIDNIIEQTEEINSLVHRMLSFSKLDSYQMTLRKTDFDLCGLTQNILKHYTTLPDGKTVAFTHSGDNTVSADRELIKTALQNLIDNAAKYALPGSEIAVDVSGRSFSVSNRAEPMTKEELRQIRLPYFRKDKSRRQKGNGLGLSIVTSILELHGAKLDMQMKDGALTCRTSL